MNNTTWFGDENLDSWQSTRWEFLSWFRTENNYWFHNFWINRFTRHSSYGNIVWKHYWKPRTCSFCGGVNPEDAIKLKTDGWKLKPTDKVDKFYFEPRANWLPVPPVKVYVWHFTPAQRIAFWSKRVIKSYGWKKYEKRFRKVKIDFDTGVSILKKLQFLFNTSPVVLVLTDFGEEKLYGKYFENYNPPKIGIRLETLTLDVLYHEFAHHLNRCTGGKAGHEEDFKWRLGQVYRSGIK